MEMHFRRGIAFDHSTRWGNTLPWVNFLIASVLSAALHGVDAFGVEVEVHIGNGTQPVLKTVGLAAGAVKESQDRVKPAVTNSGFPFPNRTITINLAPADMRKDGSAFDLPI